MASIYGFALKNRKTFQGLDWQGNQGDLCYKGKKVAWYNDSGNGGSCDIVYYDNSYAPILEETIKCYFKERPISGAATTRKFSRNQKSKHKIKFAFQNSFEVAKTAIFMVKTLKNAKYTPLCSVLIFDFYSNENQN